jgi:hypothetical protein
MKPFVRVGCAATMLFVLVAEAPRATQGVPLPDWSGVLRYAREALKDDIIPGRPLDVSRLAKLRESTFFVQESIGPTQGSRVRNVEFFEVVPAGYEVADGKIVGRAVWLDANPVWLLAVDELTGTWFHLYGFADATRDFNRLVTMLGLTVRNEQQAVDLLRYYLRLVRTPEQYQAWVIDELELMEVARRDYADRYPAGQYAARFDQWWSRAIAARRRAVWPSARRVSDRFDVEYSRYTQDDVRIERLSFRQDGTVIVP